MNYISNLQKLIINKKFLEFHNEAKIFYSSNLIDSYNFNKLSGFCLIQQKKYQNAIESYLKVIKDEKVGFDDYLNIAVCYGQILDFNKSETYFNKSLELNSKYEDTFILYAKMLVNNNKIYEAYNLLNNRCTIENSGKIINFLITISIELGNYMLSIQQLNLLIKKEPKNYIAYNKIGYCYEKINEFEFAKRNYKKSIEIKSDYPDPMFNLANLIKGEGDFNAAVKLYKKCLKFEKFKPVTFRLLSLTHKFKDQNDLLLTSMKLLEHENNSKFFYNNFYEIYFALSKAHEDLGDNLKFREYLIKGNNEKRKILKQNIVRREIKYIDILKNTFNEKWNSNLEFKKKSCRVIFIIGMPRSGTTLVEQIISSHSKVISGGELDYLPKIVKNSFGEIEKENFLKLFENSIRDKLELISAFYLEQTGHLFNNKKKEYLTDKLPSNFLYVGLLKSIFKNCRIIHCRRNPMDNCFSIYKNYFPTDGLSFSYNQKEIADYYSEYQNLMSHWKKLYPNEIHEVYYEDLIDNQETVTKKLIQYCQLDWEDACLEHYKNKNRINTLSIRQARQPIYKSSVNIWKKNETMLKDLNQRLRDLKVI